MNVDVRGRRLEIVYIRCSYFTYIVRVTRDQVGELTAQLERRRRSRIDPRDLVYRVRQPLHLRFPTAVQTPDRVG